ncbi:MAG: hypothetical protein WAT79_07885 [Saprospiraceae bacterium]
MVVDYTVLGLQSRVWIFQSERWLTDQEIKEGQIVIDQFLDNWTSHSEILPAHGTIINKLFIVLIVDQSYVSAGGCSQDKMMHFIEDLGQHWGTDLLGRTQVAYCQNMGDEAKLIELQQLKNAYDSGEITENTLVYDNLVDTKEKFENQWLKKMGDSWHKRFL